MFASGRKQILISHRASYSGPPPSPICTDPLRFDQISVKDNIATYCLKNFFY